MDARKLVGLILGIICVCLLFSCRFDNQARDEIQFVTVSVSIDANNQDSRHFSNSNASITALISAVSGSITSVTTETDLSDAYDRQLLAADNSVTLTVPLNTELRLVKANYRGEFTLAEVIGNPPAVESIGLSDAFTIDAGTTQMSITIAMTDSESVVQVSNVLNYGTVHTGFLRGTVTAEETVASVEIAIDDGSYEVASGTSSWTYQLPIGTDTWKDGSHHTVYARAKFASGDYSVVRILTVRKGGNRDVNGDGYSDFVVGAHDYNASMGRAYLYLGNAMGISTTPQAYYTGQTSSNESMLGESVWLGDVNGDGYADVIVGERKRDYSHYKGEVHIFHGGDNGSAAKAMSSQDLGDSGVSDTVITGKSTSFHRFGYGVALGDFNGDGIADLAGYAPTESGTGYIYLFYGATGGIASRDLSSGGSADATIALNNDYSHDFRLVTANFNGDDYGDLAIGLQYSDLVYVFLGQSGGIPDTDLTAGGSAHVSLAGENNGDSFGEGLAAGDINGDGFSDLIVGAENFDSNIGKVYIFNGSSSGVTAADAASADSAITQTTTSLYFGGAVAAGDMNSDGYADLMIAATGYDSTGGVFMYQGSASGIDIASEAIFAGPTGSESFASDTALSDLNGDGYQDLIISDLAFNSYGGRVHIIYSGGGSDITSLDGETAGDGFGEAIY